MGRSEAMRGMDAAIFDGMEAAGLASRGTYTAKDGSPPIENARFYMDEPEQEQLGGMGAGAGGVVATVTTLTIFLEDVPKPRGGDRVVLDDGTAFELANRENENASLSVWRARRG